MQELGVDVGDRAVPVEDDRIAQVDEDAPEPVECRLIGIEQHARGDRATGQRSPGRGGSELDEATRRHLAKPGVLDQLTQIGGGLRVTGELDDVDDEWRDLVIAGSRAVVEPPVVGRLAGAVSFRRDGPLGRHDEQWHEDADVEQLGEPEPQRSGRDVVGAGAVPPRP